MLGQTHAVYADDPLAGRVDPRRRLHCRAGQTRLAAEILPCVPANFRSEDVEAMRMLGDEVVIEHTAPALVPRRVIRLEQGLANAHDGGDVTAGLQLVILRAHLRLSAGQHFRGRLRVGERDETTFAQRIEGDDWHAARPGVLQLVQHTRAVRTDVLPKEENAVSRIEIVQRYRPHGNADALRQRDGCAFMTHVGAVGQIVRPIQASKQRVHVRRFQRCPARRVENNVVGSQLFELLANFPECHLPRHRLIPVGFETPPHRMGQAALLFQIVILPVQ